jgi:hypothetical protein
VYLEYKARQNEFKEVHKILENIRKSESGPSPQQLKDKLQDLEQQKESLIYKLQAIKKRVEKIVRDTYY